MPVRLPGWPNSRKKRAIQLGLVGLGKMGFNMRERMRQAGHDVIGYDPRPEVPTSPVWRVG